MALLGAIHSAASGMHRAGTIHRVTMGDFGHSCVAMRPKIEAAQIKKLREKNRVGQPVFAHYLNTSESTVKQWETSAKKPSGIALKLLAIVKKHGLHVVT